MLLTLPVMFARMQIEKMKATITASLNTKIDEFLRKGAFTYLASVPLTRMISDYLNFEEIGP